MTTTKMDPRTLFLLGLALVLSWLGMIIHNALVAPQLTLLSRAELYPSVVYVILFIAYPFLPFKRLMLSLILVGVVLQLVLGVPGNPTPRAFLPFYPDTLAIMIYTWAQLPLIGFVWHQLRMAQT